MKKVKAKSIGGFAVSNLNQNVRPQDDFFEYSMGGWLKNNPIPKTKSGWGTFYKLRDDVLKDLRRLVESTSDKKRLKKGSEAQLIRDLYLSGMNTKLRNEIGFSPLEPTFRQIDAIETPEDICSFVANYHATGESLLWNTWVGPDDKKSTVNITTLWQAGLSLPDRDFYLKTDATSKNIRKEYKKHVVNMFSMSCWSKSDAAQMAEDLLMLEKKIAKITMDKVTSRNIDNVYNKLTIPTLTKLMPLLNWSVYFKKIGIGKINSLLLGQPQYMKNLHTLLKSEDIEIWKTYLYWQVLSDAAPYLTTKAGLETFNFFGRVLQGNQQREPKSKRMTALISGVFGEALGREYVKVHFPKSAKKEMDEMIHNLRSAYKKRISTLDWMSPGTKRKAHIKLRQMNPKVGYPKKWKSYRGLVIKPNDYFGNLTRAMKYEVRRNYSELKKPVDKDQWHMNPQTVNAYYWANLNDIVFPAGILQPPFFDPNIDAAFNYGAIGAVIGHEMTHGFDDQGAKFDGKGNLKNWWKKSDFAKFQKKGSVLVRQFNKLKVDNLSVNGKLTLGENIADLGGALIAYDAYQQYLKKHGRKDINGFTPEQRFFLGMAVFEAGHYTKERARMLVMTDSHSPSKYRVNVPLSNTEEFHQAYSVKKTDKMYRAPNARAKIW